VKACFGASVDVNVGFEVSIDVGVGNAGESC
jgi:hypothetical protein